ncbi:cilia- and flagella-associated protein 157 [Rhynchophorus ferrugineus]|uniref:cilia- and flagella-associated protein 157 n=1 Tax=Rhynchophorus ferrugineus TaxID=354439 RepID=UPI003FCCE545
MAKKGKKGKGKKKKLLEDDPNALTEVDRTFYELTIADLNRKLARLRSLTQEFEEKNEELKQQNEKLDEDKSDIITYLKRMLQEKSNEINELEERITGLQEIRQNETEKFEAKVVELEQEYKQMHEQLTSENKLLEGKLNSLEEFRSQRDDLMKKFEAQEKTMEAQEKRHTRELYEIERKFIISKDKLKKDMEARLLQLSTEFHDASELRIAATTHRVIRENIAVNNELDTMLQTHQSLYKEHQVLKSRDVTLRQEAELHEAEKKKALSKVRIQKKILQRMTSQNDALREDLEKYKHFEAEIRETRHEMKRRLDENAHLSFKFKILEQNLHRVKCENMTLRTELAYLKDENIRLDDILMEGVSCIKEALTIRSESDTSIKSSKKENLLNTLFMLLSKGHDRKVKKPSLETIPSLEGAYAVGDLGFVPKSEELRPLAPTRRNMVSQTGSSFEEYITVGPIDNIPKKSYVDRADSELDISSEDANVNVEEEQVEEEEKQSVLFFNEEEMVGEEEEDESKDFDPFAGVLQSETSIEGDDVTEKDAERTKSKESVTKTNSGSKSSVEKTETDKTELSEIAKEDISPGTEVIDENDEAKETPTESS